MPLAAAVMAAPSAPLAAAPPRAALEVQAVAQRAGLEFENLPRSGAPGAVTFDSPYLARMEAERKRRKTMTLAMLGVLAFVGVGAIMVALRKPAASPPPVPAVAAAAAEASKPAAPPAPSPTPSAEPAASVAAAEESAPSATPAAAAPEKPAKGSTSARRADGDTPRASSARKTEPAKASKRAASDSDSSPSSSDDTTEVTAAAKPEPAEKTESGEPAGPTPAVGPPFDREAASEVLSIAALRTPGCKKLGGPTGTGTATVTFGTNGHVSGASVGGDYAGTIVGACIASLFRAVSVPAFGGLPVTLNKQFTLE
jgi:hypothetical protein